VYGELLLNEMWRKYVVGNSSTKAELTETLVDLFSKLQRFFMQHLITAMILISRVVMKFDD